MLIQKAIACHVGCSQCLARMRQLSANTY